ncbi:MAG: Shell matrix protein [Candidatus Uhrbacteria bacterium GW2011_GWD2_52_7]|uniref:Shell matrix protein n=1 Tax=Candidatus Uhrbacteria bacterium GW2011_GWD2_52_7 TaxID=1618989 RepID=A0A0G2A816_9BACT|nr:MAG: Shell matrix protein [Candidatus Uhrbacteria bacterium GW2011_GWD2_52_7]
MRSSLILFALLTGCATRGSDAATTNTGGYGAPGSFFGYGDDSSDTTDDSGSSSDNEDSGSADDSGSDDSDDTGSADDSGSDSGSGRDSGTDSDSGADDSGSDSGTVDTDTGSDADDGTVLICLEECYDDWCGVQVLNDSTGDDDLWIGQEEYLMTSDSSDNCELFDAESGNDLKFNGFNYEDGAEDYATDSGFDDWGAFLVGWCSEDEGGYYDADDNKCGQMRLTVDGVTVTGFSNNSYDMEYEIP